MNRIRTFAVWIRARLATVFRRAPKGVSEPDAPLLFSSLTVVDKPPRNEDIAGGKLYCVTNATGTKWALFQCPCSCGSVVTLSLQVVHQPHWRLTRSDADRPTLYPSVWRDKGCLSHFWLRDGRVYWCPDTGSSPLRRNSGA